MSALEEFRRRLADAARMGRGWWMLAPLLLACAGCQTGGPSVPPASSKTRVDELDLVTMPVAVNLESKLGVTGVRALVFALDFRFPKAQPVGQGCIEVLMFDGLVSEAFDQTNRCRHIWSFPAQNLAVYAANSTVGVGYLLPLAWGKDLPRTDRITLVARFIPPQGRPVYSVPSYISVPPPPQPAPPAAAASGQAASPPPPPAK